MVVVDGVACGRSARGERWDFDFFRSRSEFAEVATSSGQSEGEENSGDCRRTRCDVASALPFLVEAVALDSVDRGRSNWSMDLGGVRRDVFFSVVAVGPRVDEVTSEMSRLAAELALRSGARIAGTALASEPGESAPLPELAGSVCMGVSREVPGGRRDVAVARIAAEVPEDAVRIVAACLRPLEAALGEAPYADRLHAASTPAPFPVADVGGVQQLGNHARRADLPAKRAALDADQQWTFLQLADPTLPTGGFAHSGGLEAAVQLGLLGSHRGLGMASYGHSKVGQPSASASVDSELAFAGFLETAARNNRRQYSPFAAAAHRLARQALATPAGDQPETEVGSSWVALNHRLGATLAAVAPAYRASTSQGFALMVALETWLTATLPSGNAELQLLRQVQGALVPARVHFSCAMGLAGALLRLPEDATLASLDFAATRALVSAGVRLNLVGPQRGLALQASTIRDWASLGSSCNHGDPADAAGTAPLIDAAHGTHDLLEARAFRS